MTAKKKTEIKQALQISELENKSKISFGKAKFIENDGIRGTRDVQYFEAMPEILREKFVQQRIDERLMLLGKIINQSDFKERILTTDATVEEILSENKAFTKLTKDDADINGMIADFSEFVNYISKHANVSNPNLGINSKKNADSFALDMDANLHKIQKEGITSTRGIAERFNELGITSARGGKWSHNTVARLLRRRKELGIEGLDEPNNH